MISFLNFTPAPKKGVDLSVFSSVTVDEPASPPTALDSFVFTSAPGAVSVSGTGSASSVFSGSASGSGSSSMFVSSSAYTAPSGASSASLTAFGSGDDVTGGGAVSAGEATETFTFAAPEPAAPSYDFASLFDFGFGF